MSTGAATKRPPRSSFPPPPWGSIRRFWRLARLSFRLVLRLGCGLLGLVFLLVGSLGGVGALLRGVFVCARLRLRGVLGGVVGVTGAFGRFLRLGLARSDGAHAFAVYAIRPVRAGVPRSGRDRVPVRVRVRGSRRADAGQDASGPERQRCAGSYQEKADLRHSDCLQEKTPSSVGKKNQAGAPSTQK